METSNNHSGHAIIRSRWLDFDRIAIVAVAVYPEGFWMAVITTRLDWETNEQVEQRVRDGLGTKLREEEARPWFPGLHDRPYCH